MPKSPNELYEEYVAGADRNDRLRFDAALVGYLLAEVGPEAAKRALDSAAALVNGVQV